MSMPDNVLLLSIQPEYVKKIFNGEKTVELRRVRPRLSEGDLVLVYASCPEKALVGLFEVEKIIKESPKELWKLVKDNAGITKKKFDIYYEGATVGFGIYLSQTKSFNKPVELERLRQEWADFRPPQGYRYLKPNEVNLVEAITECEIASFSKKSEQKEYQQLVLL